MNAISKPLCKAAQVITGGEVLLLTHRGEKVGFVIACDALTCPVENQQDLIWQIMY